MSVLLAEQYNVSVFIDPGCMSFLHEICFDKFVTDFVTIVYDPIHDARFDDKEMILYLSPLFYKGPVNVFDGKSFENPECFADLKYRDFIFRSLKKLKEAQIRHVSESENRLNLEVKLFVASQLIDYLVTNPANISYITSDLSVEHNKSYKFTASNGYSILYINNPDHKMGYSPTMKMFYMNSKFYGNPVDLRPEFKQLASYLTNREQIQVAFKELRDLYLDYRKVDWFKNWSEF